VTHFAQDRGGGGGPDEGLGMAVVMRHVLFDGANQIGQTAERAAANPLARNLREPAFHEVRAKPGKEAELRVATLPLVALVRSDPKNLAYFLQEDREVPGHFVFYEIFANQSDFEAHNAMSYVKECSPSSRTWPTAALRS
jgi:quinol monooxygenase YgiN